jgi:excisionase family DNA binding protein
MFAAPVASSAPRPEQEERWRTRAHPSEMDSQASATAALGGSSAGVDADELLTPGQAGDYLRTGERFVRRLIAERRIPYVKLGRYVRLQRSALDAFIAAGRVPRTPDVGA